MLINVHPKLFCCKKHMKQTVKTVVNSVSYLLTNDLSRWLVKITIYKTNRFNGFEFVKKDNTF